MVNRIEVSEAGHRFCFEHGTYFPDTITKPKQISCKFNEKDNYNIKATQFVEKYNEMLSGLSKR